MSQLSQFCTLSSVLLVLIVLLQAGKGAELGRPSEGKPDDLWRAGRWVSLKIDYRCCRHLHDHLLLLALASSRQASSHERKTGAVGSCGIVGCSSSASGPVPRQRKVMHRLIDYRLSSLECFYICVIVS
jgi:hypothetical protein